MEGVPTHKRLFVLMHTNARTGRGEKGGLESKDNEFLVPTAEIPVTTTKNYICPSLTAMT